MKMQRRYSIEYSIFHSKMKDFPVKMIIRISLMRFWKKRMPFSLGLLKDFVNISKTVVNFQTVYYRMKLKPKIWLNIVRKKFLPKGVSSSRMAVLNHLNLFEMCLWIFALKTIYQKSETLYGISLIIIIFILTNEELCWMEKLKKPKTQ